MTEGGSITVQAEDDVVSTSEIKRPHLMLYVTDRTILIDGSILQ